MNIELTEEQNQILKQLKSLDPEPLFKGIPDIILDKDEFDFKSKPTMDIFFQVDYDQNHQQLREKLMSYRKKSQQIYRVGQLLKQYELKFNILMDDKDKLVELLNGMKGATSQLVQKQKKMINLSMKMKESLDYYSYHNKYSFDYPCEISCRQMYQNILQQTLSQLTDGMQYFQENTTYSNSKKYYNLFQNSRSKLFSFVKSFFIKLFSKQLSFMNRNIKVNFNGMIQNLYPKSKLKFISSFLVMYPQFISRLDHILKSVKQSASEQELKQIETKEMQIYQFQLTKSNISLIGYLQQYMPEIYQQSILHFFTYYRVNFHHNHIKSAAKREGALPQIFHERYIQILYILTSEYAYLCYCCRANTFDKAQNIRVSIISIAKSYFEQLTRIIKQSKSKAPFEICEIIIRIQDEYPKFLDKHMSQHYQSYAFGCVSSIINDQQHISFLKSLFNSYAQKYLVDLELLCYNMLPKYEARNRKQDVQKQIRQFLQSVPKLKYCQQHAEKYLIGALDTIVKSIKEINSRIQSRFECYIWNLQIFFAIRSSLKGVKRNLIRKELKLDVNSSSNLIQRMKGIDRNESILKYAQDIFNVLKTGMPVINQLTLDFSKYINEHCQALQNQFIKDILYIYAKNMIQFLQRFTQASKNGQQGIKELCQAQSVQTLYSSYLISVEKYIKDARKLLEQRESYKFGNETNQIIVELLDVVYEKLFDFMDKFYVQVSKHVDYTEQFKEIQALKLIYKKVW